MAILKIFVQICMRSNNVIQSFFICFEHALLVKLIDLRPVELFGLVSLYLHRICQNSFVHKWLSFQVDIFSLLKALQASFFSNLAQINNELGSNTLVFAFLFVSSFNPSNRSKLFNEFVMRHSNGDDKRFSRLAVNENLSQFISFHIGIFDLLSSNILPLL